MISLPVFSTSRTASVFAIVMLSGCDVSDTEIAKASIQIEDETINLFSLAPTSAPSHPKKRRPKCGWRYTSLGKRVGVGVKAYDEVRLACSFYDQRYSKYYDKMLILNLQFLRPKKSKDEFQIANALIRWNKDGILYRSTLTDKNAGGQCIDIRCGFDVKQLIMPDIHDKKSDLIFKLELNHPLSRNTTTDRSMKTRFAFSGFVKHRRPR